MTCRCVNTDLNLNKVSWAVLHLLEKVKLPLRYAPKTTVLYNGRERGFVICLTEDDVQTIQKKRLEHDAYYVFFAEARHSDRVVVYTWWDTSIHLNPSRVEDVTDEVYRRGKFFETPNEARDHIVDLLKGAISTFKKIRVVEDVVAA